MARRNRQKKSPVAAVCSVLGTLLLIIIVAAYLPITIPRAFGYEIYTVISGSMEPAIPTGSPTVRLWVILSRRAMPTVIMT